MSGATYEDSRTTFYGKRMLKFLLEKAKREKTSFSRLVRGACVEAFGKEMPKSVKNETR